MSEEKWLSCRNIDELLHLLGRTADARRLRLFACACCDSIDHLYSERWYRDIVQVAFAFADGSVSDDVRQQAYLRIQTEVEIKRRRVNEYDEDEYEAPITQMFREARRAVYGATKPDAGEAASSAASGAGLAQAVREGVYDPSLQLLFLRDMFGNPFRPVTFSSEWRTDTALTLARQMYESRDFSLMPILADALQDAGCDNDEVLNHCRDANQVHVRGCWVVDCVLGKE